MSLNYLCQLTSDYFSTQLFPVSQMGYSPNLKIILAHRHKAEQMAVALLCPNDLGSFVCFHGLDNKLNYNMELKLQRDPSTRAKVVSHWSGRKRDFTFPSFTALQRTSWQKDLGKIGRQRIGNGHGNSQGQQNWPIESIMLNRKKM